MSNEISTSAAPVPAAVPDWWNIRREGDSIVVTKSSVGGYVAHKDKDNIASEILYFLANDMLSAAPAAPAVQDDVVKQRDELLAVLVEAREALQFANDSPGGVAADTIWMIHRPETLFDFMDAAIASVKESK